MGQCMVLKAATSQLIANDALNLSLLISDNIQTPTDSSALKMFADAEMLVFRNLPEQSIKKLDSISIAFPQNTLADAILMSKAKILIKAEQYENATAILKNVAENYKDGIWTDDALFTLADLYEKKLNDFYKKAYPVEKYLSNLLQIKPLTIPTLKEMGFEESNQDFPSIHFEKKLDEYEKRRDYPGDEATSRIGMHLRFGTVSIREAVREAMDQKADKWLSELVWRDFYTMILWHFPYVSKSCFKPAYDKIKWRNDEKEFEAWCNGKTGYPLVDAGMRQLNEIGFMHNRVRMVVASFLSKHLLIDWRWGETYFAEKLLDYEMASNIGGWHWACG
ncbi:MAG: hypothetical protein EOO85_33920, partial [Pedobacter sp.]